VAQQRYILPQGCFYHCCTTSALQSWCNSGDFGTGRTTSDLVPGPRRRESDHYLTALNHSFYQIDPKVVAQMAVIGDVQDKDIGLLAGF
jgi:hypothetical protein